MTATLKYAQVSGICGNMAWYKNKFCISSEFYRIIREDVGKLKVIGYYNRLVIRSLYHIVLTYDM